MTQQKHKPPQKVTTRQFCTHGVNVEIGEATNHIELKLDGMPIRVSIIDGKIHCQLANQSTPFDSIDDVVDTLLANEGRTWTLRG